MKRCCTCKLELPVNRFGKNRSTSDGLQKQCKEIARNWARRNPNSGAKAASIRRALLADAIHPAYDTSEERTKVKALYEEAARLTRETGVPHEVDHIFPLAAGGWHASFNLQILTQEENRRKGTMFDPFELYQGAHA